MVADVHNGLCANDGKTKYVFCCCCSGFLLVSLPSSIFLWLFFASLYLACTQCSLSAK